MNEIWCVRAFVFLWWTCYNSSIRVEAFPGNLIHSHRSSGKKQRTYSSLAAASYLSDLLEEYGWNDRVWTISQESLPVWAEIHQDGSTQVIQVVDMDFSSPNKPPKLWVQTAPIQENNEEEDTTKRKIDLGQVTTIWFENGDTANQSSAKIKKFPMAQVEGILDQIYDDRVEKNNGWTKKKLNQIISKGPEDEKAVLDTVLRQVAKAGPHHERLIDSQDVAQALWRSAPPTNQPSALEKRTEASRVLRDFGSGRFKRLPCQIISSSDSYVSIVNGGWIVVDKAVRAATEARTLAKEGASRGTEADERILQRLEFLAMQKSGTQELDTTDVPVDVRELLQSMNLPLSPEGAQSALIDMNVWTAGSNDSSFQQRQPWSPKVLQAAEWYTDMSDKRNLRLLDGLNQKKASLEGRADLTRLPSVCVDAVRTSFRDDAIGIRPRSQTNRKVDPNAKWELLFHTTDVSDLYSPDISSRSKNLELLQATAAKRACSRYDLSGGPLHLLPPSLLETLSLKAMQPDLTSKTEVIPKAARGKHINRCVTVWAYIDETSGKLLDAGVERTLISRPLALSFQSATDLLEGKLDSKQSKDLDRAKAMLSVVERNLGLWKKYRQQSSPAAQSREDRLRARETVDSEIYGSYESGNDDSGKTGFRRTRGHRLVDSCLEMNGFAIIGLMKRAKRFVPRVAGTERDGRVASAPLRRYIDGMAQRQLLSTICNYGGKSMTPAECLEVGKAATNTINKLNDLRNTKSKGQKVSKQQSKGIRALKYQLKGKKSPILDAVSTGKRSEVVLLGVGAVATCKGIKGTLPAGEQLRVELNQVNEESGKVVVTTV